MLVQHAIWKVGAKPEALTVSKLATEKELEDTQRILETYNLSVLGGTNLLQTLSMIKTVIAWLF